MKIKNEVIVFLDENITENQMKDVKARLEQIENIDDISFYSKKTMPLNL